MATNGININLLIGRARIDGFTPCAHSPFLATFVLGPHHADGSIHVALGHVTTTASPRIKRHQNRPCIFSRRMATANGNAVALRRDRHTKSIFDECQIFVVFAEHTRQQTIVIKGEGEGLVILRLLAAQGVGGDGAGWWAQVWLFSSGLILGRPWDNVKPHTGLPTAVAVRLFVLIESIRQSTISPARPCGASKCTLCK